MMPTIGRHVCLRFNRRRSVILQVLFAVSTFAAAAYCGLIAGRGLVHGEVRIFGGGLHETLKWSDRPLAFLAMVILWSVTGLFFSRMALSKN